MHLHIYAHTRTYSQTYSHTHADIHRHIHLSTHMPTNKLSYKHTRVRTPSYIFWVVCSYYYDWLLQSNVVTFFQSNHSTHLLSLFLSQVLNWGQIICQLIKPTALAAYTRLKRITNLSRTESSGFSFCKLLRKQAGKRASKRS